MPDFYTKFNGKIDRRSPFNEGDYANPILRENWNCRDGKLRKPPGHEAKVTDLTDIPRWMGRYSSSSSLLVIQPKTFVYTEDGKLSVIDDQLGTSTIVKELLNTEAYPKHQLFKTANNTKMYLVDGANMYAYDGNEDNLWQLISIVDADDNSINPIDIIEHKDRLILISETDLYISENLNPEVFNSAIDSLHIIVGSGRGKNLALGKLEDRLYILNTEGIFVLEGDVISALASTFDIRLVENRNIIAGRTAITVEKAIVFIADDYELWSFDGNGSSMLTYDFNLKDLMFRDPDMLRKAVAVYHDNYYKMSFVENAETEPNLEIWWDALEEKINVVRGRHVSCYMKIDPTVEVEFIQMGQSNANKIVQEGITNDFDGTAISTRLRTRDITPKKGFNIRFLAFYPEFEPSGNRDIIFRYILDGRLSNPTGANAEWSQNLRGEVKTLGMISITNQNQFTGRVRPKINYARGESIAFEVIDSTVGLDCNFLGIGIDYVAKHKSKGATIGA